MTNNKDYSSEAILPSQFEVTQQDIREGERKSCFRCPFINAIKRVTQKRCCTSLTGEYLILDIDNNVSNREVIKLSDELVQIIRCYDRWCPFPQLVLNYDVVFNIISIKEIIEVEG